MNRYVPPPSPEEAAASVPTVMANPPMNKRKPYNMFIVPTFLVTSGLVFTLVESGM